MAALQYVRPYPSGIFDTGKTPQLDKTSVMDDERVLRLRALSRLMDGVWRDDLINNRMMDRSHSQCDTIDTHVKGTFSNTCSTLDVQTA